MIKMASVTAMSAATLLMLFVLTPWVEGRVISRNLNTDSELEELLAAEAEKDLSGKHLSFRVSTPDQGPLHLNLKRVEESSHSVPTYFSGKNGKIVRWKEPEGYSLTTYSDAESGTSVVVEKRKDSNGNTVRRYRGLFAVGNKFYWLAPVLSRSPSVSEEEDRFQPLENSIKIRIGNVEHYVAPAEFASFKAYDDILASAKVNRYSEKESTSRDKAHYTVELVIANDYSLWKYWYDTFSNYEFPVDRDEQTLLQLRFYFSAVADQINKRYQSLTESDFEISVKLVGFYFAKTAEESSFSEGSDVKITYNGWGYTKMGKCLEKFGNWVKGATATFGKFDHAVLYVGNYLYDKLEDDGRPSTKSGLAYMEGICDLEGGRCTSINYERGFYSTSQTGAHELGHNLGSNHDGQDNECRGVDQYVMASAPGELNSGNYKNPYTFSPCSIRYFRSFLSKLTSQNKNCLLTKDSDADVTIIQQLPGVIYGVDLQCYNYQGQNSFYCAGMIHDAELCQKIVCWDPEEKKCLWESVEHRAYAGTTCGNRKWCIRGNCTEDPSAPEASDYCTYGDYLGDMYIDEQHQKVTCDDMVKQFPEQCYTDDKSKRCCKACPSIRNPDAPECEYGDRSPARCKAGQKSHCYDKHFNRDCCAWCKQVEGTDPECLFGDQVDWCSKVEKEPWMCYSNHKDCCESCKAHSTGVKGCEYGDSVPWCHSQDLNSQSCQPSSDIGQKCCGSCNAKFPGGTHGANVPTGDKPPTVGGSAKCPNGDEGGASCSHVKQPHQCYSMEKHCCATCEELQKKVSGFAGCEYGDKIEGCADAGLDKEYCASDSGINDQCCSTCHSLKRQSKLDLIEKLLDKLE